MNTPDPSGSSASPDRRAFPVLRTHTITHIPELRVDPAIFEKRFAQGCSMTNCNAKCCHGGVYADLVERDRILAHADLIKSHMEPHQEHDTAKWFDGVLVDDIDFPSGRAIGTRTNERGCIFLKANGYCVLQVAATEAGMGKFALKPFFCVAYPVVLTNHELTLHDDYTERTECCNSVKDGPLNLLDICAEEIEYMLGEEGWKELQALSAKTPV
jgi:Fe-S-cluster containining protein